MCGGMLKLTSTRWLSGPYKSLSSSITRLLKNEENFFFCFPGCETDRQRWSVNVQNQTQWHETHISKSTNGNTCCHVFSYNSITHQKPTRGWVRSEKKWDTRHSQGPLPASSTRNICGLWNLNASYRCEMTALSRTAENSARVFWSKTVQNQI